MLEPAELFDRLEHRARAMRALFYASLTSASGGVGVLIASILFAAASRPFPHSEFVAVGTPIFFGVAGFLLGLRLPIHLPTILLRADIALGLDAKLTTLHDIRNKPDKKLFAARIAAKLPATPPHPRNAFPIRFRAVILFGATIALAVAVILISGLPKLTVSSSELLSETSISVGIESAATGSTTEATDGATLPSPEADGATAGAPSSSESTERLSLTDILTAIRSTPSMETGLVEEIDEEGLRPRSRPDGSLDAILRQIEENLHQEEVQALSAADIAALEAFQESAPSELAEALGRILEASSRNETLERISEILEDSSLFDASQRLTLPITAQENDRDAQENENLVDAPSLPMFETSTEQQGDLVLIGTTLPSTEGEEGEYTYYLTKGVPIEPASQLREPSYTDLDLSYERIESIVSGRALPGDVLDIVKAYFDRITKGGS